MPPNVLLATAIVRLHTSEGNKVVSNSPCLPFRAYVYQKITAYAATKSRAHRNWAHLRDLDLADPDPASHGSIDLLIGADLYGTLLLGEIRQGPVGSPTAQSTVLGWIVSGPDQSHDLTRSQTNHVLNCVATPDVDALLRKFWEVEEVPQQPIQSPDDAHCESFFAKTISRTPSGRYIVRLPFRGDSTVAIGESRAKALRLYHRTEDRLAAQPHVAVEYNKFLLEYETLGHMERVEVPDTSLRSVYLSHHPVFKEGSQTSNLRVVFNASCNTSNGTSLNDHLLSGPKLDIAAVILRWRRHRFVYRADIAKMFRQILVSREDADYQRIFWRPLNSPTVLPFRLLTVTYGTAPAPFLAMRVLRQLADDDGKEFPEAVEVLRHSIYVDDVLFEADELSEARLVRDQLNKLLSRGGFHL
ncbi:hypothetical protein RF55_21343, partial [Lasius niger]